MSFGFYPTQVQLSARNSKPNSPRKPMEFALKRFPAITLWIVSVNLQVTTASPLVVLSSSLPEGRGVCPGDEITFTCVTNRSASLAWSSDDYIGRGGIQLEFASFDSPGKIARNRVSPIGTQASLISKEIKENETQGILESQLNVIVTSDYPNPTINCLNIDAGYKETTSFQLLGEPDAPQGVKVIEIRDNGNVEGSCVFTLRLSPPGNIGPDDIMYYIDYQSQRDVITSTSYTFIALNCTPKLHINVTAVNRCGSIGESVTDVVPIFLPVTRGIDEAPMNDGVIIGLAVGLSVPLVAIVVAIVSVICYKVICPALKEKGVKHKHRAGPPPPSRMDNDSDKPDGDVQDSTEKKDSDMYPLMPKHTWTDDQIEALKEMAKWWRTEKQKQS